MVLLLRISRIVKGALIGAAYAIITTLIARIPEIEMQAAGATLLSPAVWIWAAAWQFRIYIGFWPSFIFGLVIAALVGALIGYFVGHRERPS